MSDFFVVRTSKIGCMIDLIWYGRIATIVIFSEGHNWKYRRVNYLFLYIVSTFDILRNTHVQEIQFKYYSYNLYRSFHFFLQKFPNVYSDIFTISYNYWSQYAVWITIDQRVTNRSWNSYLHVPPTIYMMPLCTGLQMINYFLSKISYTIIQTNSVIGMNFIYVYRRYGIA